MWVSMHVGAKTYLWRPICGKVAMDVKPLQTLTQFVANAVLPRS